ncbi:hypothetical protein D9M68_972690 [compost metagenome]
MFGVKAGQPGYQPLHGKRGVGTHLDLPTQGRRHEFLRGTAQVFDHPGHRTEILFAGGGQGDLPVPPDKQVES